MLDTMDVHDYGTDDTILNGWFSTRNLPVRSDLLSYSAHLAKQYHAARKPAMEEIACKKRRGDAGAGCGAALCEVTFA